MASLPSTRFRLAPEALSHQQRLRVRRSAGPSAAVIVDFPKARAERLPAPVRPSARSIPHREGVDVRKRGRLGAQDAAGMCATPEERPHASRLRQPHDKECCSFGGGCRVQGAHYVPSRALGTRTVPVHGLVEAVAVALPDRISGPGTEPLYDQTGVGIEKHV